MGDHRWDECPGYRHGVVEEVTDHTHQMEYAGLTHTRAVWRCTDPECDFTYSRQLTEEERRAVKQEGGVPKPDFPGEWEETDFVE